MSEFLSMGGYGVFVWPSFVVTLALMLINVFTARGAVRRALLEARQRLERDRSAGPGTREWQQEGAAQ
jgi:heme exporter protein CcmD